MAFFPRMLKTLKLLAISPVATVLWFGALGGMVFNLRPDPWGRTNLGSTVGWQLHTQRPILWRGDCIPTYLAYINRASDGEWYIRVGDFPALGIQGGHYPPESTVDAGTTSAAKYLISISEIGDRGVFAETATVWRLAWFCNGVTSDASLEIEPGALDAFSRIEQLKKVDREFRKAVAERLPAGQKWLEFEMTSPRMSGYIYNGVMVVLLLVGLYSMRWVYRGVPLRQLRQVWRPNGECGACGYLLAGLNAAKCPECGKELKAPDTDQEVAAC